MIICSILYGGELICISGTTSKYDNRCTVNVWWYFLVISIAMIKYQQRFRFGVYQLSICNRSNMRKYVLFRAIQNEAPPIRSPRASLLVSMVTDLGQIKATRLLHRVSKEIEQQACALVLVEGHRRPFPVLEAPTAHRLPSGS